LLPTFKEQIDSILYPIKYKFWFHEDKTCQFDHLQWIYFHTFPVLDPISYWVIFIDDDDLNSLTRIEDVKLLIENNKFSDKSQSIICGSLSCYEFDISYISVHQTFNQTLPDCRTSVAFGEFASRCANGFAINHFFKFYYPLYRIQQHGNLGFMDLLFGCWLNNHTEVKKPYGYQVCFRKNQCILRDYFNNFDHQSIIEQKGKDEKIIPPNFCQTIYSFYNSVLIMLHEFKISIIQGPIA
jgi:hypothetical protein